MRWKLEKVRPVKNLKWSDYPAPFHPPFHPAQIKKKKINYSNIYS